MVKIGLLLGFSFRVGFSCLGYGLAFGLFVPCRASLGLFGLSLKILLVSFGGYVRKEKCCNFRMDTETLKAIFTKSEKPFYKDDKIKRALKTKGLFKIYETTIYNYKGG